MSSPRLFTIWGWLMASAKSVREHILDTLWSQWRELGVAATAPRRHSDDVIDPEPLIAFTAVHSALDPRLRDESIDWVLGHGSLVSRARLKNVLAGWGLSGNAPFREYAATVNAHGGAGWPSAGAKPLSFRSRSRSLLQDLAHPALLSLRIRATFGVGARAELIRALLSRRDLAMTAADLSVETSYGKRNVLNELESLRLAGVVTSFRAVNADRFSLAKRDGIVSLVGPFPERFTRWTQTFGVLHHLLDVAGGSEKRSNLQKAVDAVRLLDDRRDLLAAAGAHPPILPAGASAWPVFLEWATGYAKGVARE